MSNTPATRAVPMRSLPEELNFKTTAELRDLCHARGIFLVPEVQHDKETLVKLLTHEAGQPVFNVTGSRWGGVRQVPEGTTHEAAAGLANRSTASMPYPRSSQLLRPLGSLARLRIMKDLKELSRVRLATVTAAPLPTNIFEWHVNLLAPPDSAFSGIVLHLGIYFPTTYPTSPPRVLMLTPNVLHHSHVYGNTICLDLLETHYTSSRHHGWSSAYSITSILLQLQSFLFDVKEHSKRRRPPLRPLARSDRRAAVAASQEFKCSSTECGHHPTGGRIWPWGSTWTDYRSKLGMRQNTHRRKRNKNSRRGRKNRNRNQNALQVPVVFRTSTSTAVAVPPSENPEIFCADGSMTMVEIPEEVLITIFSFFSKQDLYRLSDVCSLFSRLVSHPFLWTDEMICFHSKLSAEEDVLGYGLHATFNRGGKLTDITTPMDLLSRTAFRLQNVRLSVWKEPFEHWMPIYISEDHWERGREDFISLVENLFSREFHPHLGVSLCCKLMNSAIVVMMKGQLYASWKALSSYAHFHRILLQLVMEFPDLLTEINSMVAAFIASAENRHKTVVSSLGEFLPLVSVSNFSWKDIQDVFLEEVLDRNSVWVSRRDRSLANVRKDEWNQRRVNVSWDACKVSYRLVCFHVLFLNGVASRSGPKDLNLMASVYDQVPGGEAPDSMKDIMQNGIFEVQRSMMGFRDFFGYLDMPQMTQTETAVLLQRSMKSAHARGYFGRINTNRSVLEGLNVNLMEETVAVLDASVVPEIEEEEEEEEEVLPPIEYVPPTSDGGWGMRRARIVLPYTRSSGNELRISKRRVGNIVWVETEDEEWCYVCTPSRRREGFVPSSCLEFDLEKEWEVEEEEEEVEVEMTAEAEEVVEQEQEEDEKVEIEITPE